MALGLHPPADLVLHAKAVVDTHGICKASQAIGTTPTNLYRFIAGQGMRRGTLAPIVAGLNRIATSREHAEYAIALGLPADASIAQTVKKARSLASEEPLEASVG